MADFSEHLQSLVDDPRETLNIELKCWLDLTNKDDQATLAKAVIALANHGGGYLVLGFKELGDGTFECHEPRPTTLNGFSQDVIARIVATYADPAIQVSVVRRTRNADGGVHPIVDVPGGHRTPIMAKKGSPDQKTLIAHRIYTRRPTPESAEPANAVEWRDLLDRCIRAGRDDLLDAIRGVLDGRSGADSAAPTLALDELKSFAEAGLERWRSLAPEATPNKATDPPGWYTVAYQIAGEIPKRTLPELQELLLTVPGFTGWRPWWVPTRDGIRPYSFDDVLECYLGKDGQRTSDPAHADFWRASPVGQLFLLRGFDEDSHRDTVAPGTAFDITLPVWRIGECLSHAACFAQRLVGEPRPVTFRFTWKGLSGRELKVLQGRRWVYEGHIAKQDFHAASLTVGSDQIADQLPELVYEVLRPVYSLFDLFDLPKALVDEELQRMRGSRRPT